MADVEVLTREKAIPQHVLPTGRKLGIVHSRGVGMYEIKYVDNKAGEVPDAYKSRYTGIHYAERDLNKLLNEFWDMSDKQAKKK